MKNIILATALSFLYPGIGQIYNRQKVKGIILIVIQLILAVLNILALGKMNLLYNSIWVIGIIDALVVAIIKERRTKDLDQTENEKRPWVLIVVTTVIAYLLHYGIAYALGIAMFSPQTFSMQLENQRETESVKSEVQTYLQKKYHKKFVVDQAKYYWETDGYQFVVHPMDNPHLHFPVLKDPANGLVDGYIERLWVKESTDEVTPIVKSIYPQYVTVESGVSIDGADEKKVIQPNKILTYKEYRKKNKGYRHDLRIYVIKDVNPTDEKQNLFRLITELRKRGITNLFLIAQFYDPSVLEKGKKPVGFGTQTENDPFLTDMLFVTDNDIGKIKTADDLDQFFQHFKNGPSGS